MKEEETQLHSLEKGAQKFVRSNRGFRVLPSKPRKPNKKTRVISRTPGSSLGKFCGSQENDMVGTHGSEDTVSLRMVWTTVSHGTGLTSAPLFFTGAEGIRPSGQVRLREGGLISAQAAWGI